MSSERKRRYRSLALPPRRSPRSASTEKSIHPQSINVLISPVQNIHYENDEDEIVDTPPSSRTDGHKRFKILNKVVDSSPAGSLVISKILKEWQCTACTFLNPENALV